MAKYFLSKKAVEDLSNIWNYTAREWSLLQADVYYNSLIAACQKIAQNPELLGRRYEEVVSGLRGYKVNKHILFYVITDSGDINVLRILHERMDIANRVKE